MAMAIGRFGRLKRYICASIARGFRGLVRAIRGGGSGGGGGGAGGSTRRENDIALEVTDERDFQVSDITALSRRCCMHANEMLISISGQSGLVVVWRLLHLLCGVPTTTAYIDPELASSLVFCESSLSSKRGHAMVNNCAHFAGTIQSYFKPRPFKKLTPLPKKPFSRPPFHSL